MKRTIAKRKLPDLLPREEMLQILQREVYGFLPEKPIKLAFTSERQKMPSFAGKPPQTG